MKLFDLVNSTGTKPRLSGNMLPNTKNMRKIYGWISHSRGNKIAWVIRITKSINLL